MQAGGPETPGDLTGLAHFLRRWREVLDSAPFPAVVVALPGGEVRLANPAAQPTYGDATHLDAIVPSAEQRRAIRESCLADGIWEGEIAPGRPMVALPVTGADGLQEGLYLEAAWSPLATAVPTLVSRLRAADREARQLRHAARCAEVRQAVAMAVGRGKPLSELAVAALSHIERVIPVREARVTLLEDDTLRVYVARRGGAPAPPDARTLLAATPASLARARRGPVQCSTSAAVELFPALRPLEASGVRCVLYAPLTASEAVFGFLELHGDEREAFRCDEVELASDIARMLGTALVREKMLEQAARHAQALEVRAALGREELNRTQEQLIQAAKLSSIGELAAGLVHELNQPLNVLGGYVELLREGSLPPPARDRALDVMSRAVERMASLVDNLRNFSRSGGPTIGEVDLGNVVRMARELTGGALARGVVTNCPPGLLVRGDANRLEQVFINLVANALQAAGDPVSIDVVALDDARVAVEVRDRGPGVPEGIRPRIFEPFFTTKPPGQGTGLGLSVSARIVQEHGGRIEVDDNPGGGALFRVILPLHPARVDAG